MSIEYIRKYYKIPAKIGMRIRFKNKFGKIVGTRNSHLRIRLDGEKIINNYHPTWNIEYI